MVKIIHTTVNYLNPWILNKARAFYFKYELRELYAGIIKIIFLCIFIYVKMSCKYILSYIVNLELHIFKLNCRNEALAYAYR